MKRRVSPLPTLRNGVALGWLALLVTSVTAHASSRLTNLSVRTSAGAGSETLIVGVTIGDGAGSLSALVRAVGPSLGPLGVADALADPRLVVYSGTSVVAANDDWGGGSALTLASASVGAFALNPTSKDSALLVSLGAGGHTAQVSSVTSAGGTVLLEVYDASPAGASTSLRLTNCSARALVGTGPQILIAGFAISGDAPKRILVRGVGPGLAAFGVGGALADPLLAIFAGQTLFANNDDWSGAELSAAFAAVGAFPLSEGSADAALIVTLAPGTYTAQVSGFRGSTGVALVEIYELP